MDSSTPKQEQFMVQNRSKIDKLLASLEPPKKEKPVVLPKLQRIEKEVIEEVKVAAKPVVNLPKLTAVSKLNEDQEEEGPAKKVKSKKTSLPKLKRINKTAKTAKTSCKQSKTARTTLPKLKRIEKPVVDAGTSSKSFNKIDLPKLKIITKVTPIEQPSEKRAALPDWVSKVDNEPKKEKEKKKPTAAKPIKEAKAKKEKEKPVVAQPAKETKAKKEKLSKEEVLKKITAQRAQVDFDKIGTADEASKDDLTKIKGLGATTEEKLNALGIYKYSQIVNLSDEQVDIVTEIIGFFAGRIKRDNWNEQAQALMPQTAPKKEAPKKEIAPKPEAKKEAPKQKEAPKKEEQKEEQVEELTLDFDRIGVAAEDAADDLTNIKGIGPATAKKLDASGIRSYQQLANLKAKDEKIVAEMIGFAASRIKKDNWSKQAKELLKEQDDK